MRSRPIFLVVLFALTAILLSAQDSKVEVNKITDEFHNIRVFFMNFDSNLLVLEGEKGLLLVDAGYDPTSDDVYKVIRSISEKPIKYLINTHAHMDHFGGNPKMGTEATLILHENARAEITGEYYSLGPNPQSDFPSIFINEEISLNIYDQNIKISTLKGHTGDDVVVEFIDSKILCVGGLVYAHEFPIIDRARGGSLEDFITSIKFLCDTLDDDITIIPSHGEIYSKNDLKGYYEMLITTSTLILKEVEAGKTIEDMIAADLLKDWDDWQGSLSTKDAWITRVYNSTVPLEPNMIVSISDPLSKTIMESGVEAAKKQYLTLKEDSPDAYNYGEMEINMLGYNLMYRSMFDEALQIFEFNIQLFPESSNTYDSLGEAYMNIGNFELAIKNYMKSLEMNPENTNAEVMIEKMKQKQDQ